MTAIGDVVTLRDGSVGVVGELLPSPGAQVYRVHFLRGSITTTEADITETLDPPVFNIGDTVTLWPYAGTITGIQGDEFTLNIDRRVFLGFGSHAWSGIHIAPRWRIVKDNDERILRL
jgi:hypothetical protein